MVNKKKKEDAWTQQLKKVVLAGVGAVRLAQEEIEEFVNRLVEKGELAEQDGRKWIKETIKKSRTSTTETMDSIEKKFETQMEKILTGMNIPSKGDIEALSKKIDALAKKVETLSKKKS